MLGTHQEWQEASRKEVLRICGKDVLRTDNVNQSKIVLIILVWCKDRENWTKVTFEPDLAKFSINDLEPDVVALMKKRVLDLAGCLGKGVTVELNGNVFPIKSFEDCGSLPESS